MKRTATLLAALCIVVLTSAARHMVKPVTPDASPEACALLEYLYSINGKQVLSGQMWAPWGGDEIEYVRKVTGKYPAVRGHDLIHEKANANEIALIKDWWNKDGIPTLMWHWGAPGKGEGYEQSKMTIDIDRCFEQGTVENKAMWSDLKRIADWLTILRDAHVPVLWRPLHECDGNWFWYGKGSGAQFCRLWRTMFDYFARQRHLNNLIWVLPHSGNPKASFNPGKDYYDLAGADSYGKDPVQKDMYEAVKRIHGTAAPVPYHECGTIPDPDSCKAEGVAWSWWMVWHTSHVYNYDKNELKRLYNHELVITLDELPDLKAASRRQ